MTNDTTINVLNKNKGYIFASSLQNPDGHTFEPANEYGEPSETPIPFSDFKHINNISALFKNGLLRVDPEQEEELIQKGFLKKTSNFIEKEEIKDIIVNPTKEKLDRLLKIDDSITMDKIRNVLIELNNSDDYYIATTVFDVIKARYNEICKGRKHTEIILKKKKNETPPEEDKEVNEDTEKLTNENKEEKVDDKKTTKSKATGKSKNA